MFPPEAACLQRADYRERSVQPQLIFLPLLFGFFFVSMFGAGSSQVYVQHCIAEDAAPLAALLRRGGACVFVCGDGRRMARDVHAALVAALGVSAGGAGGDAALTPSEAEAFLRSLKAEGRYVQDIWG